MPNDDELERLQQRVKDLEGALGQNNELLAVTFKLTPVLNNLLGLLLALPNVTPEMIRQRLEIASDAKVGMHRLREHLKPFGIKIMSRRNLGYWLEDDIKIQVRKLIAEKQRATLQGNVAEMADADEVGPEDDQHSLDEAAVANLL